MKLLFLVLFLTSTILGLNLQTEKNLTTNEKILETRKNFENKKITIDEKNEKPLITIDSNPKQKRKLTDETKENNEPEKNTEVSQTPELPENAKKEEITEKVDNKETEIAEKVENKEITEKVENKETEIEENTENKDSNGCYNDPEITIPEIESLEFEKEPSKKILTFNQLKKADFPDTKKGPLLSKMLDTYEDKELDLARNSIGFLFCVNVSAGSTWTVTAADKEILSRRKKKRVTEEGVWRFNVGFVLGLFMVLF